MQGSEQPGTYVHLSGRDADDAILELYGMKRNAQKDIGLLMPKPCAACKLVNAFNCDICIGCGAPIKSIVWPDPARSKAILLKSNWPHLVQNKPEVH